MSLSLFNTSSDGSVDEGTLGNASEGLTYLGPSFGNELPNYVPPWISFGSGGSVATGPSYYFTPPPFRDDGQASDGIAPMQTANAIPLPPKQTGSSGLDVWPATGQPATQAAQGGESYDTQTVLIGLGLVLGGVILLTGGKR